MSDDEFINCEPLATIDNEPVEGDLPELIDTDIENEFEELLLETLKEKIEEPTPKRKRRTLVPPETLIDTEKTIFVKFLSGIRVDSEGNSYRIALVDGVVRRFSADKNKNYKFI